MGERGVFGLVNAQILTYQSRAKTMGFAHETALLIDGGRIVRTGADPDIVDAAHGRGDVIDLRGAIVAPGFIDPHIHAFECAKTSLEVSCLPPTVRDLADLKRRLADRAESTPSGGWIVGAGYDDTRLSEGRHPTRLDLDEALPDHPAIVRRVCGHMSVANTRALALAHVDERSEDPPGGVIVRDGTGMPTGLLLEEAQGLVQTVVPPVDDGAIARGLVRTARMLAAHGVTTICEAWLGASHPMEMAIWSTVLERDWIGPDVLFLADLDVLDDLAGFELPVIGTKLFADGVVTGRTAAVSQPFTGGDDTGILIHEPTELDELVVRSVEHGLHVGIHAMGDRAIAASIAALERARRTGSGAADVRDGGRWPLGRHRIEHCTMPTSSSLRKMRELGIVPVPQPVFLFAEGEAYRMQLGDERCRSAYPLRTMLRQGLRPALSSDAPATSWDEPIDPWLGIQAAVTRKTWAGSQVGAGEAISVGEAMGCYTANGAAALRLEHKRGSIEVGKDADLIVLPQDPLTTPTDRLETLRPELVLVKGRPVHGELV